MRKNPLGIYVHAFNWSQDVDRRESRNEHALRTALRLGLTLAVAASACATRVQVPEIPILDSPAFKAAKREPEPKPPVEYVEVPKPLPLPGQLKPVPKTRRRQQGRDARPRSASPAPTLPRASSPPRTATSMPSRSIPTRKGALYQLYAAVNQVTDIALEPGEKLVSVSAGDTVRWVVGDTTSGEGKDAIVHILVKPIGADLETNLVITTDRRTYHLEMHSSAATYMASVSWTYPASELVALKKQRSDADSVAAAVADTGVNIEQLRFRYRLEGDAPWKPRQVFDDGAKVYIQFPSGLGAERGAAAVRDRPRRQAGAGQLSRARHHLHRRPPVCRRRAAARHGAAARRAHHPHRCRVAGDAAMTTQGPDPGADPSAKVAPETLELRARPQPVTRINRKRADRRRRGRAVLHLRHRAGGLEAAQPAHWRTPQELFNVDHKPITDGLSKLPATYDGVRADKKTDRGEAAAGHPEADDPGRRRCRRRGRARSRSAARPHGRPGPREPGVLPHRSSRRRRASDAEPKSRPDPIPRPSSERRRTAT